MTRCILYRRHSSKNQSEGDSQRRQLQLAKDFVAENNHHLDTSLTYQDLAVSAKDSKNITNGNLGLFLSDCKSGLIQRDVTGEKPYLLVEHFDRVSRANVTTALQFVLEILDYVDIVTLIDRKLYKKNMELTDILTMIIYMAKAHDENASRTKRIKAAKDQKTEQITTTGIKITKQGPFYCTLSEDRRSWQIDEVKANVVKLIFNRIVNNGWGIHRILVQLNEATPFVSAPRGGKWALSTVQSIIKSPRCIGHFTDKNGKLHTDYYPQIIDEDTFYTAQAVRSKRSKGSSGPVGNNYPNLFRGIAVCAKCDSPMQYISKGNGSNYLVCASARQGKGCKYKSYRYKPTEVFLTKILSCLNYANIKGDDSRRLVAESQKLELQKEKLNSNISNLVEAIGDGAGAALGKALIKKEAELFEVEESLNKCLANLTSQQASNPDKQYKNFDFSKDRAAINDFYKRYIEFIEFDPERVLIKFIGIWSTVFDWKQKVKPTVLKDYYGDEFKAYLEYEYRDTEHKNIVLDMGKYLESREVTTIVLNSEDETEAKPEDDPPKREFTKKERLELLEKVRAK